MALDKSLFLKWVRELYLLGDGSNAPRCIVLRHHSGKDISTWTTAEITALDLNIERLTDTLSTVAERDGRGRCDFQRYSFDAHMGDDPEPHRRFSFHTNFPRPNAGLETTKGVLESDHEHVALIRKACEDLPDFKTQILVDLFLAFRLDT